MENNKNKKSVKFQKDILNFCEFIQVYVFTTNLHLNLGSDRSRIKELSGVSIHGISPGELRLTDPVPLQAVYVDNSRNLQLLYVSPWSRAHVWQAKCKIIQETKVYKVKTVV